jgi:(p)ppGpp synthase/HD superfamily hydrolase
MEVENLDSVTDALFVCTKAAAFAATAHTAQVRKELNEPYIIHPLRVGSMAADLKQPASFIAACYLHDVVEDTLIPMATIRSVFSTRTAELVHAMTKPWRESHVPTQMDKRSYYQTIVDTPGAALLKVLDRTDNLHDFAKMARLSAAGHRWAENYVKKTKAEFPMILDAVLDQPKALAMFATALRVLEEAL